MLMTRSQVPHDCGRNTDQAVTAWLSVQGHDIAPCVTCCFPICTSACTTPRRLQTLLHANMMIGMQADCVACTASSCSFRWRSAVQLSLTKYCDSINKARAQ